LPSGVSVNPHGRKSKTRGGACILATQVAIKEGSKGRRNPKKAAKNTFQI